MFVQLHNNRLNPRDHRGGEEEEEEEQGENEDEGGGEGLGQSGPAGLGPAGLGPVWVWGQWVWGQWGQSGSGPAWPGPGPSLPVRLLCISPRARARSLKWSRLWWSWLYSRIFLASEKSREILGGKEKNRK